MSNKRKKIHPIQPPIDNAFVAPGCEQFSSVPQKPVFVPSYDGGLEVMAYGLGDDAGPQYHVRMKKNGCFIAMTRSLVDARLIVAAPDLLDALTAVLKAKTGHNWRTNEDEADVFSAARAAILKATSAQ